MGSLSVRILLGLLIGLAAGALLSASGSPTLPWLIAVAQPVGKLWLAALTMTVVPLVFALLVTGVATASAAKGVAARAIGWFAVLLVGAAAASGLTAETLMRAWPVAVGAGAMIPAGSVVEVAPPGDWLMSFIPTNPIKSAAETAITPLVVFALLFGFAATKIAEPLRLALVTFFQAVVDTMLVIVRWVLWLGPLGIMALAFVTAGALGASAFGALLHYIALVCICCAVTIVLSYVVAVIAGRISPFAFARAALPAQVVALSTQSSLASLPAMIEAAPALDVPEERAAVVLPMAVSIFRTSSAAANIAVAVYLAHFHGVELSIGTLVIGILVAAVISPGAVGLPAQVSFFATIAPICLAMGVPLAMLPLVLAVETVPDIFRTVGNVTSDLMVTRLAGRQRSARVTQVGA